MLSFASQQIPPPAKWQDFELLCCDLWRAIWQDPNTQRNGRQGQPQHGVDVSGRPNQSHLWAGVQCKGKDNYANKLLTEDEVIDEVEKAKRFIPKLSEFIIATTGPKDSKIEELARKITEGHLRDGLFSVHVWGWSDIVARIEDFSDVLEKHYPGMGLNTTALRANIDNLKEMTQAVLEGSTEVKSAIMSLSETIQRSDRYNYAVFSTEILTPEYQAELDHAKDLLTKYRPREALDFLEKLKGRIWIQAAPLVKYRILTNMGSAKLSLNMEEDAAKFLIEALQYNPEDEKALCNAALGYLLTGQLEKAQEYAKKALEKNPANSYAHSVIIQLSSENEDLRDIIEKVPEHYRKLPDVAYAIAHIARKKGLLIQAIKWFKTGVDNNRENNPDLEGALGSTILELLTEDCSLLYTKQLDDSMKEKIDYAVQLLSRAWEQVANTDLRNVRLHWVVNRAVAKRIIGDIDEAIKDIGIALDAEPSNPIYTRHRALLAYENKDSKKAIDLLKKIQFDAETPEAPLLLAEILHDEKRPGEAIPIISDFLKNHPEHPYYEDARRLLIELYIDIKDFKSASEISDEMRAASSTNILNLIDAAKISKNIGNSEAALSLLKESIKYINKDTTFRELLSVANELYFIEQFEEAANIFAKIANKNNNSSITRRLLYSYYRSGETGLALEICQSLREKYGPLEFVSEIESVIYEEIGDLDNAKKVCKEYSSLFPDDFSMKLRLAVVNFRLNNFDAVDTFLNSPIDIIGLSLAACLQIAHLYSTMNYIQKSFEVMYETRRQYINKGDAHVRYIGFFFGGDRENHKWLSASIVGPDTAVCVEDVMGQREWYVIENRKDADIHRKEINVEHPFAQKLMGKSVGEEVILKESPFSKEIGKIIEIKSKFVYALHESLSVHEKLFPETSGLWGIRIGKPEKEGALPEGFQTILDEISRQHDIHLNVERFYREGKLTVGAFAHLIGGNVIDTFGGLISKPDLGIKCCNGNVEERADAANSLASNSQLIVDIISLMTMAGLDAADIIVKSFGKLGVSQSTIDLLKYTIAKRQTMESKGILTIGKEGNQFIRQEISADDVRHSIEYLENILNWVEINCEVLPCKAALNLKRDYKQHLEELLGSSFIDTVLIASEPDKLLYSDDERLRSYARSEFKVQGIWTQVLLMHCVDINALEKAKYNEMIIKLAMSNYYHTSIDADVLMEAARQAKWAPAAPYTTMLQLLSGKRSDESSALIVSTNFLFELWKQPILSEQRDYLILSLLNTITIERNRGMTLNKFAAAVKKRFFLLPIAEKQVLTLIEIWKRINII